MTNRPKDFSMSKSYTCNKMKTFFTSLLIMALAVEAMAAVENGKTYRIVPDANAKASLFVKNASKADGAPVVVWTETDVPTQQWTVIMLEDGSVALKNVYTEKYLDTKDNLLVQNAQQVTWNLVAVDEANNEYSLAQQDFLGVTSTIDGKQPALGNQMVWHFVEVEPQTRFDERARQRMLDAFLEQYLQDKGNGYRTFVNGGWNEAETLEAVLDFYEATGDSRYLGVFEACYDYMRFQVGTNWDGGTVVAGYNWFGYDFNDDVMWLIIAAARAYLITGKMSYLNDAKRNFDLIWDRAFLGYVGLLRWAEHTGDRNGANSCVNGPAEVAACYIALASGDESYYEKARLLYENQRKYLFEPYTGKVYDSVVLNPADGTVVDRNTWASTYNQGTMLGGALLLYRHYGDEQYKTDASRIIAYAKTALCNGDGIVRVCQNVDGDFQGFKGILMRYAGMYATQFGEAEYQAWIQDNAFHAYNNINSKGFGHSAWLTKAEENLRFGNVDYSAPGSAFGASTALTAACATTLKQRLGWSMAYEAEEAQRTGSAVVQVDNNTGGKYVSGLDNGNGMLRFKCLVPDDGEYLLDVYFLSFQSRNLQISISNKNYTLTCPSVSTWDNIADEGRASLYLSLKKGQNFFILTNPNGAAPHIDKIALTKVLELQDEKMVLNVDEMGMGDKGELSLSLDAPKTGHYRADVEYINDKNRNVYLAVNDADASMSVFAPTGEKMARRSFFVTLQEGHNTMLFTANQGLPEIRQVELSFLEKVPEVLEAEFASTTGQVSVAKDANASGGKYLSYIGNGNVASFRYDAPVGGKYVMEVTYFTAQNRQMFVRVNNGEKVNSTFESTGSWNASSAAVKSIELTLRTGTNVIVIGNDSGWAPFIDKIAFSSRTDDRVEEHRADSREEAWVSLGGMPLLEPVQQGIYIKRNHKYLMVKK